MPWISAAASSALALAEYSRTDHSKPLLKLGGVWWDVRTAGTTLSEVTLRYGDSSGGTISSVLLAVSTGGSQVLDLSGANIRANYLGVAATSHVATSNSVGIWGD